MKKIPSVYLDSIEPQPTTWYVIANRTSAEFYMHSKPKKLILVKKLSNPAGRLSDQDLASDKPGRGFSSAHGLPHHSLDGKSKKSDGVAKKFAKRIAQALETARRDDGFDELVIAADPHFLGVLRSALPATLKKRITREMHRQSIRQISKSL